MSKRIKEKDILNKQTHIIVYIFGVLFCIFGIYFTFVSADPFIYDSIVKAYKVEINEDSNPESGTVYNTIYYFKVNNVEYSCKSLKSNIEPNKEDNIVYYKSSNPKKCKTYYDKSNVKLVGIICLVITAVIIIALLKEKIDTKRKK